MELTTTQSQILAILSLGVGSIFVGLLPACFTRQSQRQWPLLLSALLCFGGGVLLSTALVHILPEAREKARVDLQPYTELFFIAGFFLLYLMDEVVHFIYGEAAGHNHGHEYQDELSTHPRRIDLAGRRHSSSMGRYGAISPSEANTLLDPERSYANNPPHLRAAYSDSVLFADEPPSQLCHAIHREPCESTKPTVNFGLLVALSIHSLLEGLVVGLEQLPSKVLLLLGAIASHKFVVGFCLGAELASNRSITFCKHFISILVFTCSSVGGIVVGMVISDMPSNLVNTTIPILQAIAGGTLLYVTVSEVLPRERARWHKKHFKRYAGILQLFSVIFGFAMMTSFSKYLDND